MVAPRLVLVLAAVAGLAPWSGVEAAQAPGQPPAPVQPIVRRVDLVGAVELTRDDLIDRAGIRLDEPLPEAPSEVAASLTQRYRRDGYSFARVDAQFDEPTGALTLTIDEGRIDAVEFTGVDEGRARSFAEDFALRAGDVFQRTRATDALRALLRPSRGAIQAGREVFDLVERNGRRVLLVDVDERAGMFRTTVDMGEREDWFTPVDGLVPSLGFGGAVFEQMHFNHAYVAGHLSYKMATKRAGYSLGFERPLFSPVTVSIGAELFDLTATDDRWRVSGTQASLTAFAARESVRDYYRRRGVQLHSAVRPNRHVELLFGWRGERHEALGVESGFSLWNRDETFRPNGAAEPGKLHAVVFGASLDSVGFERDSLAATYRRHLLDSPFGQPLRDPATHDGGGAWRIDWTTEIAAPGTLGGDFDFRRHIVAGRASIPLSRHEEFRARVIGGWSQGSLPPQRLFSLGGIGSVHGYGFKEATGGRLLLFNAEYAIGRLGGLHFVPFFDAGRVAGPRAATWLRGVGFGVGFSRDLRVDVGYKLDDFPGSAQVLLRLGRTF
jgi:hypothetical protein